ncbi:eCIS core domain-containing protein [Natrinema altunense]|nr:DUF4157 domain-containing protein [Natrinema altunense]
MGALGSSPELVQHAEAVSESADETSTPKAIGSLGSSTDLLQRVTDQAGPSAQSKNSSPKSDERWVAGHGGPTSLQRSTATAQDTGPAGETQVPDAVRDVISSPGRSLDTSIQRAVEDRMGDSLGDVRIHTGPKAAQACDQINARAFTVGNHVAFNAGEYDPSSPEGQHVLAHELAHVRQQTGGAVSMLPQENLGLEIDPDPQLERKAEETAQRVMEGGELGIQCLGQTEVHVQRSEKGQGWLSSVKDTLYSDGDESKLSLTDLSDTSSIEERLSALAENQKQLQAKVNSLSTKHEATIFEKVADAGTSEALKIGMTEAGKKSGLPFGEFLGSLSGAALQAIYNNREKVLGILGLKSESVADQGKSMGGKNPGR